MNSPQKDIAKASFEVETPKETVVVKEKSPNEVPIFQTEIKPKPATVIEKPKPVAEKPKPAPAVEKTMPQKHEPTDAEILESILKDAEARRAAKPEYIKKETATSTDWNALAEKGKSKSAKDKSAEPKAEKVKSDKTKSDKTKSDQTLPWGKKATQKVEDTPVEPTVLQTEVSEVAPVAEQNIQSENQPADLQPQANESVKWSFIPSESSKKTKPAPWKFAQSTAVKSEPTQIVKVEFPEESEEAAPIEVQEAPIAPKPKWFEKKAKKPAPAHIEEQPIEEEPTTPVVANVPVADIPAPVSSEDLVAEEVPAIQETISEETLVIKEVVEETKEEIAEEDVINEPIVSDASITESSPKKSIWDKFTSIVKQATAKKPKTETETLDEVIPVIASVPIADIPAENTKEIEEVATVPTTTPKETKAEQPKPNKKSAKKSIWDKSEKKVSKPSEKPIVATDIEIDLPINTDSVVVEEPKKGPSSKKSNRKNRRKNAQQKAELDNFNAIESDVKVYVPRSTKGQNFIKQFGEAMENALDTDVSEIEEMSKNVVAETPAKPRSLNRNFYFAVGTICFVMAIIGFIFTISFFANVFHNIADNTKQKPSSLHSFIQLSLLTLLHLRMLQDLPSNVMVTSAI